MPSYPDQETKAQEVQGTHPRSYCHWQLSGGNNTDLSAPSTQPHTWAVSMIPGTITLTESLLHGLLWLHNKLSYSLSPLPFWMAKIRVSAGHIILILGKNSAGLPSSQWLLAVSVTSPVVSASIFPGFSLGLTGLFLRPLVDPLVWHPLNIL